MSVYFDAITERRFYPRIAPTRPLYVPFGGNNLAMLLNLSENGLLVSTPAGLDPNSVFRLSIRLNGLPKPIEVHVRTIWTSESNDRAGIQLLDLSDHDREQIRKWGEMELSRGKGGELGKNEEAPQHPETLRPVAEIPTVPATPPSPRELGAVVESAVAASAAAPEFSLPPRDPPESPVTPAPMEFPASHASVVSMRPRRKSRAPAMVAWGAVAAVVSVGAALFLNRGLAEQSLGRPVASQMQTAAPAVAPNPSLVSKVEQTVSAETYAPVEKPQVPRSPSRVENQADNDPATRPMRRAVDNTETLAADKQDNGSASAVKSTSSPSAAASSSVAVSRPVAEVESAPAVSSEPAATPAAVSPAPAQSSAVPTIQPSTSSALTTNTPPASASDPPNSGFAAANPGSSAITGSIGSFTTSAANAAPPPASFAPVFPSSPSASPSSSNSTSAWPASGPPVAAGKSRNSLFHSRPPDASPVVQMDVNPGPVMAITPRRGIGSSFITIPGERVIDSPGMTVHIRRAVRVPSERWIWRTRKQVALGELATRIDPQPAHQPTSGSITVQAVIDKEGRVTDLKPLNGSFSFLPGVARAVREWRYEPTYVDGKPVETRAEIEIDFHIPTAGNHP